MKAPFYHRQFVIPRRGGIADPDVFAQQVGRLREFLAGDPQIGQLEKYLRIIGIGAQCLLEKILGGRVMALVLFDVAHIEQARRVAGILSKTFLEIFPSFIETPQLPVRQAHKSVGSCRRIQFDQLLELPNSLFHFAGHKVAFPERGPQISSLGRNLQTRFEQGNSVLVIIFRHADTGKQKGDVRVVGSKLVCARQKIQGVCRLVLFGINLRQ